MAISMEKGNEFVAATQSPQGTATWKQQLDEFAPGASDWVVGAVLEGGVRGLAVVSPPRRT